MVTEKGYEIYGFKKVFYFCYSPRNYSLDRVLYKLGE